MTSILRRTPIVSPAPFSKAIARRTPEKCRRIISKDTTSVFAKNYMQLETMARTFPFVHLAPGCRDGGVARMSDPSMITAIKKAVTIPVMAKARIGHFVEAQILEALGVDYVDESEVLTPADEVHHINKHNFTVPFVCGCRDLGEALRRIAEGASMIRTKGEAGTGNVVEAVRHCRAVQGGIRCDSAVDLSPILPCVQHTIPDLGMMHRHVSSIIGCRAPCSLDVLAFPMSSCELVGCDYWVVHGHGSRKQTHSLHALLHPAMAGGTMSKEIFGHLPHYFRNRRDTVLVHFCI
jgi:hypothetical protein